MEFDCLLPALDEAEALPPLLAELAAAPLPAGARRRQVLVVDNGSRDDTFGVAQRAGAVALRCPERGYGSACLHGIGHLAADPPEVLVFLDADGADDPADLSRLLAPLLSGEVDLVIGSRARGAAEPGALTPVQRCGNALACALIRAAFGARFTDLGPFRAVRWSTLTGLAMQDRGYGWTVEMQARAARQRVRWAEVPVGYRRRRGGQSKISGTLLGSAQAGSKILWTVGRELVR